MVGKKTLVMKIKRVKFNQREYLRCRATSDFAESTSTYFTIGNKIDDDGVHIMILLRCMRYEGYSVTIQKEIETFIYML